MILRIKLLDGLTTIVSVYTISISQTCYQSNCGCFFDVFCCFSLRPPPWLDLTTLWSLIFKCVSPFSYSSIPSYLNGSISFSYLKWCISFYLPCLLQRLDFQDIYCAEISFMSFDVIVPQVQDEFNVYCSSIQFISFSVKYTCRT